MIGSRPARRVTLQGDLATPRGVVEGGGRKNGAGMIARRSELGELGARIARARAELASCKAKSEVAGQQVSALRQAIEALAPSADEVAGKLAAVERSARAGAERAAMIRGELRVGLLESLALERDRGELLERRTEIAQEQERIDAALARNAAEHARLEEDVRRLAEARPAMREERARLELELARLRERLSALGKQLQALENGLDENRQELRRLEKQTQEFALRQEGRARGAGAARSESARAARGARAAGAGDRAGADRPGSRCVRCCRRCARNRMPSASASPRWSRRGARSSSGSRRTASLKGLEERSIAELGVALALLPAPAAELPEAVDWSAVEAEILDLKGKMQRLGAVNMEAIDELGQIDERLAFMTKERDDLVKAQRSLKDMIAEMDQESRTRFQNTFEEVRKHFQVIFRQLFRGGHADLMLSEGEDVLEAGVEVIAAPPGKKPQTITLLSGGERTLTAVGLLFALFKMKPSPICVLDEVDAALDESNIERFCSMLSDYEASTQFLIVTHSKRTMSRAEVLYGVTMEGDGISRPIAIRLKEYQEKVA
jgi:chromosome segregation protein